MQLLRTLSRVAFICNICFLLASFIQWLPHPPEGVVISTIIVLGYFLAILVNIVVNSWVAVRLAAGRLGTSGVPGWLVATNFVFFVVQLLLLIFKLLINR